VASTALLGDDLHLWMAKQIHHDGVATVLLRPHKRCFSAIWKHIYKKDDKEKKGTVVEQWNYYQRATGKPPDIIVADLKSTHVLLQNASFLHHPFVAYIDEFISDSHSNREVASICKYLPKQTVLLSSILPPFDSLPKIVNHFCQRYETTPDECIFRVATSDVNISCAVIDKHGYLCMPHHLVNTQEQVEALHQEIQWNPRIRRCYPAKYVYHWSKSMETVLTEHGLRFEQRFSSIGKITNKAVIDYAVDVLYFLKDHPEFLEPFQSYRPRIMPAPEFSKILKEQARYYEGKTLFITKHMMTNLEVMIKDLFDPHLKWNDLVAETERRESRRDQELDRLRESKMTKLQKDQQIGDLMEMNTRVTLPSSFVINSQEHFERFRDTASSLFPIRCPFRHAIDLPKPCNDAFDNQTNLLLAAGVGMYEKTLMTEYQRDLVMSVYHELLFLLSGKDIVFGTNLPNLTNIFIDSSFAKEESIAVLYQLMGRVGRMGRSYHANVIVDSDEGLEKILSLHHNTDQDSMTIIESLFTASV